MNTRQEALEYGLSFPDTYQEAPFHDPNWQLVRVKGSSPHQAHLRSCQKIPKGKVDLEKYAIKIIDGEITNE